MPNKLDNQGVYMGPYSSPETFNPTTLYQAGDLGKRFLWNGAKYQIVLLDNGTAPVANGLVFWANKTAYTVTGQVSNTGNGQGRNGAAGRAPLAAAASTYLAIQLEGRATLTFAGTTSQIGDVLVSSTNSTKGETVIVAQGTAPTCMVCGIVVTASTGTSVVCDLNVQIEVD